MISQNPFDPKGFLTLAETLASNPAGDPATYRSALSRAYYAVFLVARESLTTKGVISPSFSASDHGLVIRTLRSLNRQVGDQLDKLRRKRNRADYVLTTQVSQAEAMQTVATANALRTKL